MEASPKIVYRQTSNRLVAAIDFDGNFNDKTVHILVSKENINIDLKVVLAILNSKMINYFFQSFKQEEGRAFAQVKIVDIKNLPFVVPSDSIQKELAELTDQIMERKKQGDSASYANLEDRVDALVYDLYGLSKEEIEVVENY
jgi:hypothetical protein